MWTNVSMTTKTMEIEGSSIVGAGERSEIAAFQVGR